LWPATVFGKNDTMPITLASPRQPRAAGVGIVLALHAALLLGLSLALRPQTALHPSGPPTLPLTVRLLEMPRLLRQTAQPDEAPSARRPAAPLPRALPAPIGAITLPAEPPAEPASAPQPVAHSERPIDLQLRRQAVPRTAADLARDDPRANSVRPNFEQRLSNALDTRVIEQDLGNGRGRFRQGDRCVEVHDSRSAQIDPFNPSAATTPKGAMPCD
jgi:hypothetical protein